MTLITDDLKGAVGQSLGVRVSPPITATDIKRWAMAVYYPASPPPLFWDEEYATTTRWGGIVAPEDFNPFAWTIRDSTRPSQAGADPQTGFVSGPEATLGMPTPELRNQLNGGEEAAYTGVRMRPGDSITSNSAIAEYTEAEGRLGAMLFTVTENRWSNQRDELIKVARSTLIRY